MAEMVSRIYSNFRGVDFRGDEINLLRSPDALNVWKDYKETESIRTRPALEYAKITNDPLSFGKVNGIYFYKESVFVHEGQLIKEVKKDGTIPTYFDLLVNDAPSVGFVYNDVFYFIDGEHYLKYDGICDFSIDKDGNITDQIWFKEVEGYVPTTTISRAPSGGGTVYEDVNMLSDYRKNSFTAESQGDFGWGEVGGETDGGVSFTYVLDAKNIDDDFVPVVTVNDEVVSQDKYTVNYAEGTITFIETPPEPPNTDGQDNVVIKFKKTVRDKDGNKRYSKIIPKCTMVQIFDNRVFYSGNPDYPNMVWNCSLNDPTYISDLDYYNEGRDAAKVKGMAAGNNALWVFREPSDANTTVFYHTPSIDDEYGKIYPSSHSSITTGCVGKAINFNDDIVFFSERGMEGINGDITTEQVVAHRSSLVDRKMIAEADYKNMQLAEWEGYLLVFIGNKVYLADSRAMFPNENHYEYEWFMWEFNEYNQVICTAVKDGVLYIGTDNGVFTLTDKSNNVESYWTTPLDKFNYPHRLKTTNKRGCVAEATGDISVYAKLEDTDFELIGKYENVTDYFVSRIKRKKFKDLQLKFHSYTRFSLETVTLEAFIGGYIKR